MNKDIHNKLFKFTKENILSKKNLNNLGSKNITTTENSNILQRKNVNIGDNISTDLIKSLTDRDGEDHYHGLFWYPKLDPIKSIDERDDLTEGDKNFIKNIEQNYQYKGSYPMMFEMYEKQEDRKFSNSLSVGIAFNKISERIAFFFNEFKINKGDTTTGTFAVNYTNFVLGTLSSGDERLRNALNFQCIEIVENGVGNFFNNSITLNKVSLPSQDEITNYAIRYDNISQIELIFKHEGNSYGLNTVDSIEENLYIIPSYTSGEGGTYPTGGPGEGDPWIDEATGYIYDLELNDNIVFYARLKGATYLNELTVRSEVNLGSNYNTIICFAPIIDTPNEDNPNEDTSNEDTPNEDVKNFCLIHLWGDFQPRFVEYLSKGDLIAKLESNLESNPRNFDIINTIDGMYTTDDELLYLDYLTFGSNPQLAKDGNENNEFTYSEIEGIDQIDITRTLIIKRNETLDISVTLNVGGDSNPGKIINYGTIINRGGEINISSSDSQIVNFGDIINEEENNRSGELNINAGKFFNKSTGLIDNKNGNIQINTELINDGVIDIRSTFADNSKTTNNGTFLIRTGDNIYNKSSFLNKGKIYYSNDRPKIKPDNESEGVSIQVAFVESNDSRTEAKRLDNYYSGG